MNMIKLILYFSLPSKLKENLYNQDLVISIIKKKDETNIDFHWN